MINVSDPSIPGNLRRNNRVVSANARWANDSRRPFQDGTDQTVKRCVTCKDVKPITAFRRRSDYTMGRCRDCCNATGRRHYYRNLEKQRARHRVYRQSERGRSLSRFHEAKRKAQRQSGDPALTASYLFYGAKQRATRKNIPFSITVSDIVLPDRCPVLGIPIRVGRDKCSPGSPSLDRIKPKLGYVPGNIAVISYRANTLKSDGTLEEIEAVAAYLRKASSWS